MRKIDAIVDKLDADKVDTEVLDTIIKIARGLRLGTVQSLYNNGDITAEEARQILQGSLKPGDAPYDDSALFKE